MTEFPLSKARVDFPLLTNRVRGKNLVYLDSAASGLKPWPVIERVGHFLTYQTSNVHRGAHFLSDQATTAYEQARQKVADFIHAQTAAQIIFTRGTTESVNLVAQAWGRQNLKKGDVVLLTEMEHHSNIVPWQMIAKEVGAEIRALPVTPAGELDLARADDFFNKNVKMVAVTHASNTLGTINDIALIAKKAHAVGALIFVDGAQMIANHAVDVQALDVDFYAFSGHKLFGPYGIGVLYGKKALLESMGPYQGGGSMISEVAFTGTTYHDIPFRLEAGTPNIEGAVGLAAAIEYVEKLGWPAIEAHESALLALATQKLSEIPEVQIVGTAAHKVAILSFNIKGAHPSDVGQILDQENVAVRAGHHCTQPLMKVLGITGTVRASFSVFNSPADIEQLVKGVIKAKEMLL
ncbi:MAG: aminotransferase class V-fold PLP-dependent enzyme [Bdellovibrio sp.]|jgi:cysteine desulfurase/selenocysteine lyase